MNRFILSLITLATTAFFCAAPLSAQENKGTPQADLASLRGCIATGDEKNCVGAIARICMAAPGGTSTAGAVECFSREQLAWDVLLNERYKRALAEAKRTDGRLPANGADSTAVAALRTAQRAWLVFRDAECARLYFLNIEGTFRSIASADCGNQLTALRAIDFGYLDK